MSICEHLERRICWVKATVHTWPSEGALSEIVHRNTIEDKVQVPNDVLGEVDNSWIRSGSHLWILRVDCSPNNFTYLTGENFWPGNGTVEINTELERVFVGVLKLNLKSMTRNSLVQHPFIWKEPDPINVVRLKFGEFLDQKPLMENP